MRLYLGICTSAPWQCPATATPRRTTPSAPRWKYTPYPRCCRCGGGSGCTASRRTRRRRLGCIHRLLVSDPELPIPLLLITCIQGCVWIRRQLAPVQGMAGTTATAVCAVLCAGRLRTSCYWRTRGGCNTAGAACICTAAERPRAAATACLKGPAIGILARSVSNRYMLRCTVVPRLDETRLAFHTTHVFAWDSRRRVRVPVGAKRAWRKRFCG